MCAFLNEFIMNNKIEPKHVGDSKNIKKVKFDFPVKLLSLLSNKENSVICPYGIATVLSMAAEGACEESLNEILHTLGYENKTDLRESVLREQNYSSQAFKSENGLKLKKGSDEIEVLEDYKKIANEFYRTTIKENDGGKSSIELENISIFKAEWLNKLSRDTSYSNCFRNEDGTIAKPSFLISKKLYLKYAGLSLDGTKSNYAKCVALPYKDKSYEMILVNTTKTLSLQNIIDIFRSMESRECIIKFPEFRVESDFDLIPMMQRLGLKNIFEEYFPAFDHIATQKLYVESFKQKAKIDVDKNGTTAQAVTTIGFGFFSCMPLELVFDRPFSYFLRNTSTGEILFMGKVNKLDDCERKSDDKYLLQMIDDLLE